MNNPAWMGGNAMTEQRFDFPENFIWGTSTAGHQVEGGNQHSDWWSWEQQGWINDGTLSGRSVDYWNRYEQDHDLMNRLGYPAFRLGIEWARVEPQRGVFNREAIEGYRRILESLRAHGIRICLTINHWVLPYWVSRQGDWMNPRTLDDFERFGRHIVKEFGAFPHIWVTLNEPMVPAIAGNLMDYFPPQRRSFKAYRNVSAGLLEAHARMYRVIHELAPHHPDGQVPLVGVAHAYPWIEPWGTRGLRGCWERLAVRIARLFAYAAWDRSIVTGRAHLLHGGRSMPGLRDSYDYCGVNYYTRMTLKFDAKRRDQWWIDAHDVPENVEKTQMGWQIYPPGMYHTLQQVWQRFGKPILITENGIADDADLQRPRYLLTHLLQVHRALQEGIPVIGYFHWSFVDNYEWREGFSQKFGLVAVDHRDPELRRTPRPSARLFSDIIRENAITESMLRQYVPDLIPDINAGIRKMHTSH